MNNKFYWNFNLFNLKTFLYRLYVHLTKSLTSRLTKEPFKASIFNIILSSLLIFSAPSFASTKTCFELFSLQSKIIKLSPSLSVSSDPVEQWLIWEETANNEVYRQTTAPVAFDFIKIPRNQVIIWEDSGPKFQGAKLLISDQYVIWVKHKYNQSPLAPFSEIHRTDGQVMVRLTASSSVVIRNLKMSLKIPTDTPHPSRNEKEPYKVKRKNIIDALKIINPHIQAIDRQIGLDPHLVLLRDAVSIAESNSGNGVIARDLSPLYDGNYYLPAFSLPFVGDAIAIHHGANYTDFWQEHYARALGRAKAKMLIRYRMQMETPNPQNILIQLDKNLMPTGAIVFRDYADSEFYAPIMRASKDKKNVLLTEKLKPYFLNSSYLLGNASEFTDDQLNQWHLAHDMAYAEEIESLLQVNFLKRERFEKPIFDLYQFVMESRHSPLSQTEHFLRSEEGQTRIRQLFSYSTAE